MYEEDAHGVMSKLSGQLEDDSLHKTVVPQTIEEAMIKMWKYVLTLTVKYLHESQAY